MLRSMNEPAPELEPKRNEAPVAATWRGRFREGAAAPWVGLWFLNAHRELWKYAAAPIAANLVITFAVLAFLIASAVGSISAVRPWLSGVTADWPNPVRWVAELIVAGLLVIVLLGVAFLLWKFLTGILCGYFYELLAKRVEENLGVAPGELRDLSLSYQIVDTCYDLAALLAIHTTFFVVGLLPLVGAPLAVTGDFSLTWFVFGADYFDYPLALRGWRRGDRRRYCREHLPHTLGLGAVVFFLQLIPFAGALFLTTAVVGAVLLHRRLKPPADLPAAA
jgi:CysZ protein